METVSPSVSTSSLFSSLHPEVPPTPCLLQDPRPRGTLPYHLWDLSSPASPRPSPLPTRPPPRGRGCPHACASRESPAPLTPHFLGEVGRAPHLSFLPLAWLLPSADKLECMSLLNLYMKTHTRPPAPHPHLLLTTQTSCSDLGQLGLPPSHRRALSSAV